MPEAAAGAMPGPDATSSQAAQPPSANPAPSSPATGDDGLSDPGREAIRRERDAAKEWKTKAETAQKELERLTAATQTDSERAISAARAEERSRFDADRRRFQVRLELQEAGLPAALAADLSTSERFAGLKVGDDGSVDAASIAEVIEKLRTDTPAIFGTQRGSADGGVRGPSPRASSMNDYIRQAAGVQPS